MFCDLKLRSSAVRSYHQVIARGTGNILKCLAVSVTPLHSISKIGNSFLVLEYLFASIECLFGVLSSHCRVAQLNLFLYVYNYVILQSFCSSRSPYGFFKRSLVLLLSLLMFLLYPARPCPSQFNPSYPIVSLSKQFSELNCV